MKFSYVCFLAAVIALVGCGGGGSSSSGASPAPAVGGITLIAGDNHLDNIEAVIIDIDEVVLIGGGAQQELIANDIGPINLLDLRNVTEVIAAQDVPARTYSKIRLRINSIEIQEVGNPARIMAQLPANGKIDLVPQGTFEISPGEDLVIQIDFDLERSVHLVLTGNSKYQFRPVVFVDVIDQTDNLRLVHLFGTVEDDQAESEASEFDLCELEDAQDCYDVNLGEAASVYVADGTSSALADLPRGDTAHVFGHFYLGVTGEELFRAIAVVMGGEDDLAQIDGDVASAVVDGAFDLIEEEGGAATNVVLLDGAKVLDKMGQLLGIDIAPDQEAEAWAQQSVVDAAEAGSFPTFLLQVRVPDEEESVEGTLLSITDSTLEISNDEGVVCVVVDEETEIQLLSDYDADAEAETITATELATYIDGGVEVKAYGMPDGECFVATFIAAEVEGDE